MKSSFDTPWIPSLRCARLSLAKSNFPFSLSESKMPPAFLCASFCYELTVAPQSHRDKDKEKEKDKEKRSSEGKTIAAVDNDGTSPTAGASPRPENLSPPPSPGSIEQVSLSSPLSPKCRCGVLMPILF